MDMDNYFKYLKYRIEKKRLKNQVHLTKPDINYNIDFAKMYVNDINKKCQSMDRKKLNYFSLLNISTCLLASMNI